MTGNRRIARVRGIEISVNWTWLLVVALITWSLADQVFPERNPGLSDAVYVAMALIAALLFFSSLLAHELGHALRALREGLEIEGIILWLLGGVARFKDPFPNAGAELRIALAGPAVSLVLGVLFTLVAAAGQLPSAVDGGGGVAGLRQPRAARLQPPARAAAGRRTGASGAALACEG